MESCDALVVGGGPAGSTCAWQLKEAGMDVLVVDKAPFPRHKPCAGWVTPPIWDALRIRPEDYPPNLVLQTISALRTGVIGDSCRETRYEHPVSYGIRRCEFDNHLLARSGARRATQAVTRLRRSGGAWIVNEAIRTPLLIGAGGHFCPVARFLGARLGEEPIVAAQEVEFRMDARQLSRCRVEADAPELYFTPDVKGYGWCFRKGEFLNVGLGREDRTRLTEHVRGFVEFLQREGRVPAELSSAWQGHAYLLYDTRARTLLDDGVLLVGDAAGVAYTPSGEGIRPAVESGLLAARTLLAARGDYSRASLQRYVHDLDARLGTSRALRALAGWLPASFIPLAARAVLDTAWLARSIVVERWFLRRHQPALNLPPAV